MEATILVIDDSADIHRLVANRLKGLDVRILSALDGRSGITLAHQYRPDLILLDVKMPGLDGFGVIRELKSDAATYNIPVIFLSGEEETQAKVLGFDLGAVDYVTKPFNPAELRARVRAAIKSKKLMDMLTSQAMLDGLTGLHNRRYFDDVLRRQVEQATEMAEPLGLALLDIDRFKMINDQFGHPMGDQILQAVSRVLERACRKQDLVCRFGGEEFAMVLALTTLEETGMIAERLRIAVNQAAAVSALLGHPVTISIGYTAMESNRPDEAECMVQRADDALYLAKTSGRNQCRASAECTGTTATAA